MNDTVFYVVGACLVAVALITSFVGLRYDKFPGSRGVQLAGILLFVLLVGASMTFAWRNAEDEQATRDAEQASGELPTPAEVDAAEASGESVGEEEQQAETTSTSTGATSTTQSTTTAASADGAKLFVDQGCSSCHTLKAANATGTTGPNLDTELKGKPPSFIETSIVDPNAEIAKGYPPDVMPQNFGTTLSQDEINALVQYLVQSTSGK
jgi:mono/diheme cytochrome c family protein